ncbi:hypothetical protein ACFE04_003165 [Oxalis oulophora]
MPIEARDRLTRPVDIATIYARRRSGALGILSDEPATPSPINPATPRGVAETPIGRGRGGVMRTNLFAAGGSAGHGTRILQTPSRIGRENTLRMSGSRRARGSGSRSVLPSWYPRTPLRDITAVVRAIERRRARLREMHGQENETTQFDNDRIPNSSTPLHGVSRFSPNMIDEATPGPRPIGKLPKILLNVTKQTAGDSEFLTPQKKLLNSIDTVEKEVMKELQKLKRTPSAKKETREKKVRTLMSMR